VVDAQSDCTVGLPSSTGEDVGGAARVYHGNVGSHVFHAPNHILPRRWRRISAAPVSRKCWLDNLRQSESLPQLGSLHR